MRSPRDLNPYDLGHVGDLRREMVHYTSFHRPVSVSAAIPQGIIYPRIHYRCRFCGRRYPESWIRQHKPCWGCGASNYQGVLHAPEEV